jgi:hypothetical protein
MRKTIIFGAVCAVLGVSSVSSTWADDQPAAAPATPAPAAPAGPTAMSTPAMTFPLAANPNPLNLDAGPLGKVYITGALTGLGLVQSNAGPNICNGCNKSSLIDVSNAQVTVQKTDGWFQFFLEGGGYSFPTVGVPYNRSADATDASFGVLPVGYIKLAPGSGAFSIEAGKLPSLFGDEYMFTFEDPNIERGLLWNQENIVSRGVQANYTTGPLAFSLSVNDGYYSNKYNWVTGSVAWTINSANTLSFVAGDNFDKTSPSDNINSVFVPQNNGSMYNLIYMHTSGAWTIEPMLQYQEVESNTFTAFGVTGTVPSADAWGASLLVNYAFNANWSLPVRGEYESTSGMTNLLYGPGSKAWSLTVTPTYQDKIFFGRFELSYIEGSSTTPGDVFGSDGMSTTQARAMLETGIIF